MRIGTSMSRLKLNTPWVFSSQSATFDPVVASSSFWQTVSVPFKQVVVQPTSTRIWRNPQVQHITDEKANSTITSTATLQFRKTAIAYECVVDLEYFVDFTRILPEYLTGSYLDLTIYVVADFSDSGQAQPYSDSLEFVVDVDDLLAGAARLIVPQVTGTTDPVYNLAIRLLGVLRPQKRYFKIGFRYVLNWVSGNSNNLVNFLGMDFTAVMNGVTTYLSPLLSQPLAASPVDVEGDFEMLAC